MRFVRNLLVAFVPAVVLGLAIGDHIELLLGNAVVVAWALIIGGIAILLIERWARPTDCGGVAKVSFSQSVGDRPGPVPGDDPRGQPLGRDDPRRDGAWASTARPPPSSASSSPCRP